VDLDYSVHRELPQARRISSSDPFLAGGSIDVCHAMSLFDQSLAQETDQLLLSAVRMLSKMCRV
jgi:hypothetical protein